MMNDPCQLLHRAWQVEEFKRNYPELRLRHLPGCGIRFEGELSFRASLDGYEKVEDTYSLRGVISPKYPSEAPRIFETGGRIPEQFHHFSDESLCLGSPLGIRCQLEKDPSLSGLIENLLIPYLYNFSHQKRYGTLPLGELEHGAPGLVADYEQLFNVRGTEVCTGMLSLLGLKKRIVNKYPCPCGSGKRLGKCHNTVLNRLRPMESRGFFRKQAQFLKEQRLNEKL